MGMWKGDYAGLSRFVGAVHGAAKAGIGHARPVTPACCGTCQDKAQSCNTKYACCLQCHFSFEEKHLLPYLPLDLQDLIRAQHQWLILHGFPPEWMDHHSRQEEEWYRQYCPPELVAQVEEDHDAYDEGRILDREAM